MSTTQQLNRLETVNHFETEIDPRIKISALWASVAMLFAFVDLFSLYRADVLEDLLVGKVFVFDVSETFLLAAVLYIVPACLMVFFTLLMRPRLNRIVNMSLASFYVITTLGSAVGEMWYYVLGSVIEAILLGIVFMYARALRPADRQINVETLELEWAR